MSDLEYPQYSEDAILGDKGRRIVENIIRDSLGWLFREIQKDDLGIDAFVEILREDRKSHGRLFAMQIKCGPSYFSEVTSDGYVYRGDFRHLNYWLDYSLPVVLVLCDDSTQRCYWVQITAANVERTAKGWKVVVPRSQTLSAGMASLLEMVTQRPQPNDFIRLALYRLLHEKFPRISINPDIETPRDFSGFDFMAGLDSKIVLITYIYKPSESFVPADIDDLMERERICAQGCGWETSFVDEIIVFLVAHTKEQLHLTDDLLTHISKHAKIKYFRAVCSFDFGISLSEIGLNGEYIMFYGLDGWELG